VNTTTTKAYLKGSYELMMEDMERARRDGYKFGAKLVRGAYMTLERRRAAERGYPSPIWDTLADTHANYDRCVKAALREVAERGAELMIASVECFGGRLRFFWLWRFGWIWGGGRAACAVF
jgi:proline dehydrogenase